MTTAMVRSPVSACSTPTVPTRTISSAISGDSRRQSPSEVWGGGRGPLSFGLTMVSTTQPSAISRKELTAQ
jgi:hypothetical protein